MNKNDELMNNTEKDNVKLYLKETQAKLKELQEDLEIAHNLIESLTEEPKEIVTRAELKVIIDYAYRMSRRVRPCDLDGFDGRMVDFYKDLSMNVFNNEPFNIENDDFYRPIFKRMKNHLIGLGMYDIEEMLK